MSGEITLVFLGGIADSGKSALMGKLKTLEGVEFENISDHFKTALGEDTLQALDFLDWKSKAESKAVQNLGNRIQELRQHRKGPSEFSTLIVNTHFATYSPGGFMMGLDPPHIQKICEYCNLCSLNSDNPGSPYTKAAVILVDIAISDVLQRREAQWTSNTERSATGPGLIQDLEFNRLYALQYYNALAHVLGPARVAYKRVVTDWRITDNSKPKEETTALTVVFGQLADFLRESGIITGKLRDS